MFYETVSNRRARFRSVLPDTGRSEKNATLHEAYRPLRVYKQRRYKHFVRGFRETHEYGLFRTVLFRNAQFHPKIKILRAVNRYYEVIGNYGQYELIIVCFFVRAHVYMYILRYVRNYK